MKAYLYVLGVPRSNLLVLPATCWPSTYEHTPENVAALAEAGALLIQE